jgi:two-component system chemotaxis response regulator CheB
VRQTGLIALGTSTGGPQSLETVLAALEPDCPPVVVVQHMPEHFTRAFAHRLDGVCRVTVKEAAGGETLTPGTCFIAPGGRHLEVRRVSGELVTKVFDGPKVNRHSPSVDVLFRSLARLEGVAISAAVMTGMGDDGARGLLELRRAGAATYAQDEASCVVYGMPKEAVRLGAAQSQVKLVELAQVLQGFSAA